MKDRRNGWVLATLIVILAPTSAAATTASVEPGLLPRPVIVNVYWDRDWDFDNGNMPMNMVDNFTSAVASSAYFGNLSEYGFDSASLSTFSVVAQPGCGNNGISPKRLQLYDPLYPLFGNPGVLQFLNCEIANGYVPSPYSLKSIVSPVLYNIMLAPQTLETDTDPSGWFTFTSCEHNHYTGYHFLDNASIPNPIFPLNFQPPQNFAFTVIFSNPACNPGGFYDFAEDLTHEMTEAISDPEIGLSVVFSGGDDEIGDIAESACNPYRTPFLAPFGDGSVALYWSDQTQGCPKFSVTAPLVSNATVSGFGPTFAMTLYGSGFGQLPGFLGFASNEGGAVDLSKPALIPYFEILDRGQNGSSVAWRAGNSLESDPAETTFTKWTDAEIQVAGIVPAPGQAPVTMSPGDRIDVYVCNPASGICETQFGTTLVVTSSISSIKPPGGPASGYTQTTIVGNGFGPLAQTQVLFGGLPATVRAVTPTTINVITPPLRPGNATVQVLTTQGTSTTPGAPGSFAYCGPSVSGLDPGGSIDFQPETVSVLGSCFTGARSVRFGPFGDVKPISVSDSRIVVTSPAAPSYACRASVQVISPDADGFIASVPSASTEFAYGGATRPGCNPLHIGFRSFVNVCVVDPPVCFADIRIRPEILTQPPPFSDLEGVPWATAAIDVVVSQGIMGAEAPSRFLPDAPVTRAEFARDLAKTFVFPRSNLAISFDDVDQNDPSLSAYVAAQPYMAEFTDAQGTLSFNGAEFVSRKEAALAMASIIVGADKAALLEDNQVEAILARFPDRIAIEPYLQPYVATALADGLLVYEGPDKKMCFFARLLGFGRRPELGLVQPDALLTRADLASMLARTETLFETRRRPEAPTRKR